MSFIDISPVSDLQYKAYQLVTLDIADSSIVSDSKPVKSAENAGPRFGYCLRLRMGRYATSKELERSNRLIQS